MFKDIKEALEVLPNVKIVDYSEQIKAMYIMINNRMTAVSESGQVLKVSLKDGPSYRFSISQTLQDLVKNIINIAT